ncbi:hypothetical protein BJV85_002777 [Clostridium acetobutylicum]|uniref:Uncharacterized protein n=1 Tax=Clostridium acetobutylicum (strain ATCC 824 / DSM 792 / JCM 1419 / IAM 19013 / LMG 5710 / NBRC 13948 / NRRL B-527 / VKM B-1787 / 2291 / W) TaxID=272562 RepID=Q97JQ2_CLOAB|nr:MULTISPECIES: hypothetical protein [Clostridium]AAK79193.1 Hypothetical protein CA_C1221 [Clostridium acetobutylicum ATCC 824]ADZ20271.1 Conserved hypothetical protein [Clostridium acetobutylicum EA 2018]AEI31723.1 hypothetical protein SMB_G1241 [Clostridium acetobutylicum DSM 1731]AWV81557.1 hypothetical protein DK921_15950 [Clostridium acetobutylicum]MBC2393197.1 hypothetical protein [Clostridium acetobutylicum]
MKRDKKVTTYPNIKIIKPFFWKECRFCHKEFKKEQGFEIEDLCKVQRSLYRSISDKYKDIFSLIVVMIAVKP